MSLLRRFIVSAAFLLPLAINAEPALKAGEALTYRVGWGIFMHAGEIKITANALPSADGDAVRLQVVTTTATRGIARAFFSFRANAESLYDGVSGRLLMTSETTKSDKKETDVSTTFDYTRSVATHVNAKNPDPVLLPMPAGDPQDLIMSLVQTRHWNLKPGEHQDALVVFGDEFYELTIHAERYEEVRTPLGTFNTLVLVPRMDKTPPKGMFKRGGGVRVWIAQDERRLPVKFQVEFKFGSGVATLAAYQPPEGEALAEKTTAIDTPAPAAASDAKNFGP